jgi:membrane protein YqaA with SNARE-associated domain
MDLQLDLNRWQTVLHGLHSVFAHFGGLGLLFLSLLDSSPLFVPLGNDLMMIAMTARKHNLMPYYALMAAFGSVLGCLIVDALSRKGGEKGFEKAFSQRKFNYVRKQLKNRAAWALTIASLLPPPFPFTAVVAGTAALQYPRKRLLLVTFFGRLARFTIEGVLAIFLSRKLLRVARSPVTDYFAIGLILVSVLGSVVAIVNWARHR